MKDVSEEQEKLMAAAEEQEKLMAAAPELLEALKNFVILYKQDQLVIEGDDGNDPVVTKALAAIAKATGDEDFSQYYQPQKESDLD